MDIEKVPYQFWADLILGKSNYALQALPLKILLSRLRNTAKFQPDDAVMEQSVAELKNIFYKCRNFTSMQNDFNTITAGGYYK